MVRYATKEDISRIAEILVFGKRVAYRSIFGDNVGYFRKLQVLDVITEYQNNATLLENTLLYDDGVVKGLIGKRNCADNNEVELNGFVPDGQEKLIEGTLVIDKRYVKEL